jgi:glycosyl hydrolase family 26
MRVRNPKRLIAILAAIIAVTATALMIIPAAAFRPVPKRIWLGVYPASQHGESYMQAVQRIEHAIGRPLGAVRVYAQWDDYKTFPSDYHEWLRDTDHAMYFSVKAWRSNKSIIKWADIAGARPGSRVYDEIVAWAEGIKGFGDRVFFIFNHEPEAKKSDPMGTSAQFVAAWRHIVDIFRAQGVTNARYVWVMTDYAFQATDDKAAAKWFPGDGYVDQLGSDPYNWFDCRGRSEGWTPLSQKIEAFRRFGQLHPDKGLILAEWGSVEDDSNPGRKEAWIAEAADLFQRPGYEQFRGLLYFNSRDGSYPDCEWYFESSGRALDGFRAFTGKEYFTRGLHRR